MIIASFYDYANTMKQMKYSLLILTSVVGVLLSAAHAQSMQPPASPSTTTPCGWFEPNCWDIDACTSQPGECVRQGSIWVKVLAAGQNLYRCGSHKEPVYCYRLWYSVSGCPYPGNRDDYTSETCEK